MKLLSLSGNYNFARIDNNLSTKCSSDNVVLILDNYHSELKLVEMMSN